MHFKHPDDYQPGDIIIPAATIEKRLDHLATQIGKDYAKKKVLFVGLLTGAAWLTVDLLQRLYKEGITDAEMTFMKVSSYTSETTAASEPRIDYDSSVNPQGRNVLFVDDIADTGKTLVAVTSLFASKDVASLKSIVLLDKPSRRVVSYQPDYCGFVIPDMWVQGRGMDTNGVGRGDPNIIKGPFFS